MAAGTVAHTTCASCGAALDGPRFCSSCGEAVVHEGDLRIGHLTHDFLHEFTHLDGKIWRTLIALIFKPGKLTREYWEGRRGLWVRPLRLYLVISALQLLLAANSSGPLGIRIWVSEKPGGGGTLYSVGNQPVNVQRAEPLKEELNHRIQTIYLWVRYVSLALFAAASLLTYRKAQPYYGAHVIFALHFYSFEYLMNGLTAKIPGNWMVTATPLLGAIYLFFALRRLYGQRVWKTIGKTLLLFAAVALTESAVVTTSLLIVVKLLH